MPESQNMANLMDNDWEMDTVSSQRKTLFSQSEISYIGTASVTKTLDNAKHQYDNIGSVQVQPNTSWTLLTQLLFIPITTLWLFPTLHLPGALRLW